MSKLSSTPPASQATPDDIRRLFRDIEAEDVLEILKLVPSVAELEEAMAWLTGQGDVVARLGRPQTSKIAAILDIVEEDEDEEPSPPR